MTVNAKKIKNVLLYVGAVSTFLAVPVTTYADAQVPTTPAISSSSSTMKVYDPPIDLANSKAYEIMGTGTSGNSIKVTMSDQSGNHIEGSSIVDSSGFWRTMNMDTSNLSDGPINVLITQTTADGSMTSQTFSTTKNTTIPVAPTVSRKRHTINKLNSNEYEVSGTGTPGCIVHITLTDSKGGTVKGQAAVGQDGTWSDTALYATTLNSGPVLLEAYQTNEYGNAGPKSTEFRVRKTTVAQPGIEKIPLHYATSGNTSSKYLKSASNSTTITSNGSISFPSGWSGIFILNAPKDALTAGHMAAGVLLPNGLVYYESFDDAGSIVFPFFQPGKWDPADYALTMDHDRYLFPNLQDFREWLVDTSVFNEPTSPYDQSNITFIARSSTQTYDMETKENWWRNNTPQYNLGGYWDCQSLTDNIMQVGSVNLSYFSAPVPNTEQYYLNQIAEYGYTTNGFGGLKTTDPQGYDFYMWNPYNNTLWWNS